MVGPDDMLLDLPEDHVWCRGDALSLVEACKNLVFNAFRYGVLPVTVAVRLGPRGMARVAVEDCGSGVPEEHWPDAARRYARQSGVSPTSAGLGLAIVEAVAKAHQGQLRFGRTPAGGFQADSGIAHCENSGVRPRALVMAVALMVAPPSWGQEAAEAVASFGNEDAQERLWIKGATDIPFIAPALQAFVEAWPEFHVTFESWNSNDLYRSAVTDCHGNGPVADLLISSSVDQQVKLVNDGCAQPYRSLATAALPNNANWRDELFGVTSEPVVMVYNRTLVPASEAPASRFDLLDLLRRPYSIDPMAPRVRRGVENICRFLFAYYQTLTPHANNPGTPLALLPLRRQHGSPITQPNRGVAPAAQPNQPNQTQTQTNQTQAYGKLH